MVGMKHSTYKIVLKQAGSLMILLGIIETVPSLVSIIYREWYSAGGFLLSGLLTICFGYIIHKAFRQVEEPQFNQALIIAASVWLALTFMGGLPFYIIANMTPVAVMNKFIPAGSEYTFSSLIYFKNPLHCFFESMSAYTTTGLSMAIHEPSVGKGVLFYRRFAQWVGGAGFIIMVLAVFKQHSGRSAMLLLGQTLIKLRPKVIDTSRVIWKAYLFATIFSAVYLIIGTHIILPNYPLGENIFDSINHAMAGQSTGGFSTLDDSIASYNSAAMDMLYLLPMILGTFSLPFFYKIIYKRKFSEIWKDIQTRSLIIAFIVGCIVQSISFLRVNIVPNPIREGIFQFISGMSTTGWQTSNIGVWDWKSTVLLLWCDVCWWCIGGNGGWHKNDTGISHRKRFPMANK